MKATFYLLVSMFLLVACGPSEEVNTDLINNPVSGSSTQGGKVPVVTISEQRYEFGTISQGEGVRHEFEISNTGEAPLLISDIYGSCGCTVVENWKKDPIKPGEKTSFTAVFSSENKEGQQTIKLFVVANTVPSQTVAVLAGNVVKPKQ